MVILRNGPGCRFAEAFWCEFILSAFDATHYFFVDMFCVVREVAVHSPSYFYDFPIGVLKDFGNSPYVLR